MTMSKTSTSPWHEGELLVQERAGTKAASAGGGKSFRSFIPDAAVPFIEEQRVAVLATLDVLQRPWASVRVGEPGFMSVPDPATMRIRNVAASADPLVTNLQTAPYVGVLIMDLARRRRMRMNGKGRVNDDGSLVLDAVQVFGNCPQYIQQRELPAGSAPARAFAHSPTPRLNDEQMEWVRRADTMFVASVHPAQGADASHRGGHPGFVHVEGPGKMVLPDYSGNGFFNTLGNIAINPKAGLTIVDFDRGHLLMMTGRASLDWDPLRAAAFKGAERLLDFEIDEVRQIDHAIPSGWRFQGYSPFNP